MSHQVKNPNKRVNIISLGVMDKEGNVVQEPGILMRVTRQYAQELLSQGTHTTTTKSKLKSFLNKSRKLHRTSKFVEKHVVNLDNIGKTGKGIPESVTKSKIIRDYGKIYLYSFMKNVSEKFHTGKMLMNGEQEVITRDVPRYMRRVLRYPSY